jgi:Tfp pilus assembly protein FimV
MFDFALDNRTGVRHTGGMGRTHVRWGRVVVSASLVLGGAGLLGSHGWSRGNGGAAPVAQRIYVVRSGDTVWSIAGRVAGARQDRRPVVDAILEQNRLPGAVIIPGGRLLIPG